MRRMLTCLSAGVVVLGLTAAHPASADAAAAAPDLLVTSIVNPAAPSAARVLAVRIGLRNGGTRVAPASGLSLSLSTDRRPDVRDSLLARRTIARLRPGSRRLVTLAPLVPARVRPGLYHLLACVDDRRRVRERNERNNCRPSATRVRVRSATAAVPGPGGAAPPLGLVPPAGLMPPASGQLPPSTTPPTPPPPPDVEPPDTEITGGPVGTVRRSSATLAFRATEAGSTFECRLDAEAFTACSSPKELTSLAPAPHVFAVRAIDAAGNVDATPATRAWTVEETPPPGGGPSDPPAADPAASAPAIGTATATSFDDATSFLYAGADPIQKNVRAGAIDIKRVTVLRGRVRHRMGGPLAGIRITVLDHPELGRTATRVDGGFDLAVNGGGSVVLRYERAGFVDVQRQVEVPWQDYVAVDDVVMIPYDDAVTAIDLTSPAAMQVARANAVTDTEGTRRATLMFSAGTDAEMVMPDGSTRPLGSLSVRATEYTIGASGPAAMPGALPAGSGYTYAVELSVDEAVEAGATEVRFDQPVINYVENFLGFPTGGAVPTGYYDRERGVWVPSPNGRVIEIVAESAGLAELAGAAGLVITEAERARLAALYEPGQSLWRVAVMHFTPWDYNWPFGPPPDAIPPPMPLPFQDRPKPKKECYGSGSIIGCQSQRLGQAITVAGTPFALDYWSDRTPGRLEDRALEIPLSGASVPASLSEIKLEITVAGRVFRESYGAAPNQRREFVWDGKDAYGRTLQGAQPVAIRVGYRYGLVQYATPGAFLAAFGRVRGSGVTFGGVISRASAELVVWRDYREEIEATLGNFDARGQGLGGWTLDVHHTYDPARRTVHLGDGRSIDSEPVVTTAGGTGESFVQYGSGGPATQARLGFVNDVATAPDGSVYVAQIIRRDTGLLSRIRRDGTIELVAGQGGSTDEGVPAAQAALGSLRGIDIGPDGSVYVAEANRGRVRRIDPAGNIRTFAGGGPQFADNIPATQADLGVVDEVAVAPDGGVYLANAGRVRHVGLDGVITTAAGGGNPSDGLGDGGPATQATIGRVNGIAVSPQGELFIGGDAGGNRIRRVDAGGRISTVAGGGTPTDGVGDGGPGTLAAIGSIYGMDFGPDGSLVFAERRGANFVRRLAADGTITTAAGRTPQNCCGPGPLGDRGPATQAGLGEVVGVSVAPDGSFFIATHGHNAFGETPPFSGRVRRVSRPSAVQQGGAELIPSTDGSQAYEFNPAGRHLRTLDGLTGATQLRFGYDGAGRLVTVSDEDGNVTTVERTGGTPTAIVAPGGQRTALEVDVNGWISRIAKPEDQVTTLAYTPSGLMTQLTDPRGGVHRFEHDQGGRLTRDEDPDTGVQTLARISFANGYRVEKTTVLGRVTAFSVRRRDAGGLRLETTDPSGATTTVDARPDGSRRIVHDDGTLIDLVDGPDPRWDYAVPTVVSSRVTTPGGLIENTTHSSEATPAGLADPFAFQTLVTRTTSNGQTTTSGYDATTRTLTRTSPAGRRRAAVLDARGRVVRAEPGAGLDPLVYSYDTRGLTSGVQQGPHAWTFERDARRRVAARTDAQGRRTAFAYDAADRVTAMTTPSSRVYGFGYDRSGNRTAVTLPDGARSTLGFTPGDRLERFTPAGGTAGQTRAYDRDHRLIRTTNPGGRVVVRGWNPGGRATSVTSPEATTAITYTGATDRPATIDRSPAGGGTTEGHARTYDGDLPRQVSLTGTAVGHFDYTFDANRRLRATKLTSGADVVDTLITRDADGLATGFGPFALERNGPGAAISRISGGALQLALEHDGRARVRTRTTTVAGTAAYGAVLTRDPAGRITRKVETVAGVATTLDYTYDADGRLTGVDRDGSAAERYAYDQNGNRSSRRLGTDPVESLGYDAQDRLATRGATTYDADADGHVRRRGADDFVYGTRGELLSATVGGITVTYAHDGLGRRVGRTEGGATTRYLYGNPGDPFQVSAVRAPSGVLTTYYHDEEGLLYAMRRGGSIFSIATDQIGTPRVVTDGAGAVVKALTSDSFGVPGSDSAPAFDLPFGFAGGLADPVTGLVRFGFRDYEPTSGRWTARDPVLYRGGQANLYVYAGNDPVAQRDPSGLACIGGSAYSGIGGGASLCITDEGLSLCAEAGFGVGTDLDIDPTGDLADPGSSIVAEAKVKFGPAALKIGGELDSSGCLSGAPELELGPIKLTPDDVKAKLDIDVEVDGLDNGGGLGAQVKIAAKVCGNLPF